jgi:hypothetical protein
LRADERRITDWLPTCDVSAHAGQGKQVSPPAVSSQAEFFAPSPEGYCVHAARDILEARGQTRRWRRGGLAMTRKMSDDPKRWREQAEKARRHAEQVSSPEIKQMMLELKLNYEHLARRAEKRLRKSRTSK